MVEANMTRKLSLVTFSIVLMGLAGIAAWSIAARQPDGSCLNPVVLGGKGLDAATIALGIRPPGTPYRATFPVLSEDKLAALSLGNVRAKNEASFIDSLLDDDPTYLLRVDLVTMRAGGSQTTQLGAWRYGRVICPFVLDGGGPAPH
jgi:hypothetical protein